MIVALLSLIVGGAGGYWYGRARTLHEDHKQPLEPKPKSTPALPPARGVLLQPSGDGVVVEPPSPVPTTQYRAPDLTAVINIPVDSEDFDQLGDALCACYSAMRQGGAQSVDPGSLRDCILEAIYPDFQWPPVPGDPPTAQLMWMIADHESRKAVAGSALSECPPDPGVLPPARGPGGLVRRQ